MHDDHDKKVRAAVATAHDEYMRSLAEVSEGPEADLPGALSRAGFGPTVEVEKAFRSICRRVFDARCDERVAVDIARALLATPAPAAALLNLERYFERAGDPMVFFTTVATAPPILEMVALAFGASQYMADIIVRNPNLVYWLMEASTWAADDAEHYLNWFEREASLFTRADARIDAVRRAHRQALLRAGLLDMLGRAPVEETTARLSRIADAIVSVVLAIVREELRGDRPEVPADLAVIALGKLGGGELNYSSDIDIIYVCGDGDDETVAMHTKVARRLGEALSEATGEGYLYRVDLRLRPDGRAGPLVNTESSMRIYYENRGRPWEFQAMLKARVIAGDRELGTRVLGALSGLVYSTSLPYSPLESIAAMRERIVDAIPARERGLNIKLMSGGIRDVEFITQTLQLLHGPSHTDLRTGNTLHALDRIAYHKLLDRDRVENLADAYRFLRIVEHRLQMMHQLKTHTVPESRDEVELLARRVARGPLAGYEPAHFTETLSLHLGNVRTISESFYAGEEVDENAALLMLPEEDERVRAILRGHNINDVARSMRALHAMAYGSFPRLLDRNARKAFERLLPVVLDELGRMGDPELALIHLAEIASAGRAESAFYTLLCDNEPVRDVTFGIAGFSSVLTRRLCNHIDVLDSLPAAADAATLRARFDEIPEWDRYSAQLARKGGNAARERHARQAAWFDRVRLYTFALAWQNRFRSSDAGSSRSWAAARQVSLAFDSAFPDANGMTLFALGSYAIEEPRMTSDLDLIVVTDGIDIAEVTEGVQRINQWFTDGGILKFDFRLRGEGASAPLVQDVSFYEKYFAQRMSLWERVAMSKCRAWWGCNATGTRFLGALHECLARPFRADEIAELDAMRSRLEQLVPRKFPQWDTKRAAGGRYDVEYVTAIGLAACAADEPGVIGHTTPDRLQVLVDRGFVTDADRHACLDALETFGVVEYLMELQSLGHPRSREKHDYLQRYLDRCFEYLGIEAPDGVESLLDARRARVREIYRRVIADAG